MVTKKKLEGIIYMKNSEINGLKLRVTNLLQKTSRLENKLSLT